MISGISGRLPKAEGLNPSNILVCSTVKNPNEYVGYSTLNYYYQWMIS
jgi:hypothetical protein